MMKVANNDTIRKKKPNFYALYIKRSIDFIISNLHHTNPPPLIILFSRKEGRDSPHLIFLTKRTKNVSF